MNCMAPISVFLNILLGPKVFLYVGSTQPSHWVLLSDFEFSFRLISKLQSTIKFLHSYQ